jgi:branched-chain amino acid transport system ATP-binding protein
VINMLLEVKNLNVHYAKSLAIDNISVSVPEGSIVTIVGANGSGKSTILKAVSGIVPLSKGEVWFDGKRIDGTDPAAIVRAGLVQIPEGRRLFPFLTVLVNLKLGATLRRDKAEINDDLEAIFERFPRLKERRNQKAGTLSGGEQQMLAIGRGLMAKPRLLMLDEPSIGLAPVMVETVGEIVKDINKKGVTILLVEQNASLAFGVAKQGYALQVGRCVFEGSIEEMKGNPLVRQAYLGGSSRS